ncbi:MAG: PKD domain-containing protein, partial [Maioricimonas sp. JB049]
MRAITVFAMVLVITLLPFMTSIRSARAAPPVVDPGGPYEAFVNENLLLDGSASFDPDGDPIIRATWHFGDGSDYEETPIGAPDGDFDLKTVHAYAALGPYLGLLEMEDLSGEIGIAVFIVEIVPHPDQADFLATALELSLLLETIDLPKGVAKSFDRKLMKIIEDVEESGRYDLALNQIKALLNHVDAQAGRFTEAELAATLQLVGQLSLTGAMILNPQLHSVAQAPPMTEWRSYEITVPVGVMPYDVHIIYDVNPLEADVVLKGWTASVLGREARFKTDSNPLRPGAKYRGGKFSARVPVGA